MNEQYEQPTYEELIEEVKKLTQEKNVLLESLCLVKQKYNNDKARYRRKAKVYRLRLNKLKSFICQTHYINTSSGQKMLAIVDGKDEQEI